MRGEQAEGGWRGRCGIVSCMCLMGLWVPCTPAQDVATEAGGVDAGLFQGGIVAREFMLGQLLELAEKVRAESGLSIGFMVLSMSFNAWGVS